MDLYEERMVEVDTSLSGLRIDKALANCLPEFSRSRIQQWIALGAVQVNGHPVLPKYKLALGAQIQVSPQPNEAQQAFVPDDIALEIVFEDADVICLNKPAGLVTHPGHGNWRGTVMNGLLYHRPESANLPRAGIVHRLDKDTSGLMVVAKTESAMNQLVGQLADRSVDRRYLAIARGHLTLRELHTFDGAIGRDPRDPLKMAVTPGGKTALTHVTVLAQGQHEGEEISLVQCKLATGRTHQIRVHLSNAGYPLIGDATYDRQAKAKSLAQKLGLTRQALHAWQLGFVHPLSRAKMQFQSSLPRDMLDALQRLGMSINLAESIKGHE